MASPRTNTFKEFTLLLTHYSAFESSNTLFKDVAGWVHYPCVDVAKSCGRWRVHGVCGSMRNGKGGRGWGKQAGNEKKNIS